MYECPKCGREYKSKPKTHYEYCKRSPLPDELADIFFSDPSISARHLSQMYDTSEDFMTIQLVEGAGVPEEIVESRAESRLSHMRNANMADGHCRRCYICVFDNEKDIPPGWAWHINGRIGDLCYGCAHGI